MGEPPTRTGIGRILCWARLKRIGEASSEAQRTTLARTMGP